MMCMLYVPSSASTRMKLGLVVLVAAKNSFGPHLSNFLERCLTISGCAHFQKGLDRPTRFSHIRLWLSWIPSEIDSPSGCPKYPARLPCGLLGSPCSYSPCPASCIVP